MRDVEEAFTTMEEMRYLQSQSEAGPAPRTADEAHAMLRAGLAASIRELRRGPEEPEEAGSGATSSGTVPAPQAEPRRRRFEHDDSSLLHTAGARKRGFDETGGPAKQRSRVTGGLRAAAVEFVPGNPFVPLAAHTATGSTGGRQSPTTAQDMDAGSLQLHAANMLAQAVARQAEEAATQAALSWCWSRGFWSWVAVAPEPAATAVEARQTASSQPAAWTLLSANVRTVRPAEDRIAPTGIGPRRLDLGLQFHREGVIWPRDCRRRGHCAARGATATGTS